MLLYINGYIHNLDNVRIIDGSEPRRIKFKYGDNFTVVEFTKTPEAVHEVMAKIVDAYKNGDAVLVIE